jgi:hypothetical protein
MDKYKMCPVSKIAASEFSFKPYSTDAGYCKEGCVEENWRDGGHLYMCVSKLQCSVESVDTIVDKFYR